MVEMEIFGTRGNVKAYAWFELKKTEEEIGNLSNNIESKGNINFLDIESEKLPKIHTRNENWMKYATFVKC